MKYILFIYLLTTYNVYQLYRILMYAYYLHIHLAIKFKWMFEKQKRTFYIHVFLDTLNYNFYEKE